jgi:tetratricopeptide (TPR) repeat protein
VMHELAIASGSKPADEALQTLQGLFPETPRPGSLAVRAWLLAMLGRFEEAWPLAQQARERERELTGTNMAEWLPAEIASLEGDHGAAVDYLQPFCDLLEELDHRFYLSSVAPMLGRELCALDRYADAERYARLARELEVRQNMLGQATWRQVQARVHASRGKHAEADVLAHEAVTIAERTDGLNYQGDAFRDLAEVLEAAGRSDEAASALEQALDRYVRKKNLAMVAQVTPRLEEVRKTARA